MRDPGKNDFTDIIQKLFKGFTLLRRLGRQCFPDLARLNLGEDRIRFDIFVLIGDPIHHGASVAAELIRGHVVTLLSWHSVSFFVAISLDL